MKNNLLKPVLCLLFATSVLGQQVNVSHAANSSAVTEESLVKDEIRELNEADAAFKESYEYKNTTDSRRETYQERLDELNNYANNYFNNNMGYFSWVQTRIGNLNNAKENIRKYHYVKIDGLVKLINEADSYKNSAAYKKAPDYLKKIYDKSIEYALDDINNNGGKIYPGTYNENVQNINKAKEAINANAGTQASEETSSNTSVSPEKVDQLKKAIENSENSKKSAEFLLNSAPNTVANVKDKLIKLLDQAEQTIKRARTVLEQIS